MKKLYFQPEVQVARVALEFTVGVTIGLLAVAFLA